MTTRPSEWSPRDGIPPLMLRWTCQNCGWTFAVAAPGFAGDGRDHFPDGRNPCGPITAQRDVHYVSPETPREPIPVAASWDEVHRGIAADNKRDDRA